MNSTHHVGITSTHLGDGPTATKHDSLVAFLSAVLPEQGRYISARSWVTPENESTYIHRDFDSIGSLAKQILAEDAKLLKRKDGKKETMFFALGAFGDIRKALTEDQKKRDPKRTEGNLARTQENVRALKSFWLDLDIKDEDVHHKSKGEALRAVYAMVSALGLPAPMVVSSGGGLHIYWPLTREIAPPRWSAIAGALGRACRARNVLADPSRTTDSSSVLRPIGTHNYKIPGEPREVRLLSGVAKGVPQHGVVDPDVFAEKLSPFMVEEVRETNFSPRVADDLDDEFSGGMYPKGSDKDAGLIADRCAQMGAFRECKGNVPEPLWYASLGVLTGCVDGERLAHEWSSGHPNYDQGETTAKFHKWMTSGKDGNPIPPPSCAKLKELNAAKCEGCKWPALGVANPMRLGYETAPGEKASSKDKAKEKSGAEGSHGADSESDDCGPLLRRTKRGYQHLTASIAAGVVANRLKGEIAYDAAGQCFCVYDDGVWVPGDSDGGVWAEQQIWRWLSEACEPIGYTPKYADDVLKVLRKQNLLQLPEISVDAIPFKEGLYNMRTGGFTLATPKTAATWRLPHVYSPDAKCEFFQSWLETILGGGKRAGCDARRKKRAKEVCQVIRACINKALRRRSDLHYFLLLTGYGGAGKSTLITLLEEVFGRTNCVPMELKNLEEDRFAVANAKDKRMVFVADAEKHKGKITILKKLSGGDTIPAPVKWQQIPRQFVFDGIVVVAANEDTFVGDDHSSGLARRKLVVRFDTQWTPEEVKAFKEDGGEGRLFSEVPGIINWALGLSDDETFRILSTPPEETVRANLESISETNVTVAWLFEHAVFDPSAVTYVGAKNVAGAYSGAYGSEPADEHLFPSYIRFCERENRVAILTSKKFGNSLVEMGNTILRRREIVKSKDRNGTMIKGIRLRKKDEEHFDWTPVREEETED